MFADIHMHSHYSDDSEAVMEEEIQEAIKIGLPVICFTDHIDWDYPIEGFTFNFDIDQYMNELAGLQDKYRDRIQVLRGVELGMQTQLGDRYRELLEKQPFDYALESQHLLGVQDPYYPSTFEGHTEAEIFRQYFECTLENVRLFHSADTLAHLDYVVRYGIHKAEEYSYAANRDIIDEILKLLIRYDMALEVNTAGFRKGLSFPNPHPDVIKRYRELGGKLITLGSDAHVKEDIAKDFGRVSELLRSIGFTETCYFVQHQPQFLKL